MRAWLLMGAIVAAVPQARAASLLETSGRPRPAMPAASPFAWMQAPMRSSGLPIVFRPSPQVLTTTTGRNLASYQLVPTAAAPAAMRVAPPVIPAILPPGDISCVPFARAVSGIDIKGDAAGWWERAAGSFQRGSRPEPGAVLAFRATEGMPLGHVAVVTRVINPRLIQVDHANWGSVPGRVTRGASVSDVSPGGDWSQVRLIVAETGDWGSTYPIAGFIYRRPDTAVVFARR